MSLAFSIRAIGIYQPTQRISATDIISNVDAPDHIKEILHKLFKKSQFNEKAISTKHETAIFMIEKAFQDALNQSGMSAQDIDMLIYCGCLKGVIEISQAHLVANALGLTDNIQCFDVTEACAGWVRALEVAGLYIQSGKAKNVLIVSGLSSTLDSFNASYSIKNEAEIEYKFAALTVGSVASATIVSKAKEINANLKLFRKTNSENVDLCMIPLEDYESFTKMIMPEWQQNKFAAKSRMLLTGVRKINREVLAEWHIGNIDLDVGDILITHSVSKTFYDEDLKPYPELSYKYFSIYPLTGNIADNTIPVAIRLALDKKLIKNNACINTLICASGDVIAFCSFNINLNEALSTCNAERISIASTDSTEFALL